MRRTAKTFENYLSFNVSLKPFGRVSLVIPSRINILKTRFAKEYFIEVEKKKKLHYKLSQFEVSQSALTKNFELDLIEI